MKKDFNKQKESLMEEVRSVLGEIEELYNTNVEEGSKEAKALKAKLQDKLSAAKDKLSNFEQAACKVKEKAKQADELVQENPYYAMGVTALAGLVIGILLGRR